jgi:hypothetical protein
VSGAAPDGNVAPVVSDGATVRPDSISSIEPSRAGVGVRTEPRGMLSMMVTPFGLAARVRVTPPRAGLCVETTAAYVTPRLIPCSRTRQ